MHTNIIKIGNSKGIRIPAKVLQEYNIQDEVQIELQEEGIMIKPIKKSREGWDKAFKNMHERGDDQLLLEDIFEDEQFEEW